jgi:hypothetical protein
MEYTEHICYQKKTKQKTDKNTKKNIVINEIKT